MARAMSLEELASEVDPDLVEFKRTFANIAEALASEYNKISISAAKRDQPLIENVLTSPIIPAVRANHQAIKLVDLSFLQELDMGHFSDTYNIALYVFANLFGVTELHPVQTQRGLGRLRFWNSPGWTVPKMLEPHRTALEECKKKAEDPDTVLKLPRRLYEALPSTLAHPTIKTKNRALVERIRKMPMITFDVVNTIVPDEVEDDFRQVTVATETIRNFAVLDFLEYTGNVPQASLHSAVEDAIEIFGVQGVDKFMPLRKIVEARKGRHTLEDYIATLIELSPRINIDHLTKLFKLFADYRVTHIPYASLEQSVDKFRLPGALVGRFKTFIQNYRPKLTMTNSSDIEVYTSVERYIIPSTGSLGFMKEVQAIADILPKKGIVCLVDHTSYTPSFFPTNEYKAPGRRVISALSHAIIERRIPALADASLVGFSRSSKIMKAIRDIQMESVPDKYKELVQESDLAGYQRLHDVLRAARRYNEKVVIVIDGSDVEDQTAFRNVLKTVQNWGISSIVISPHALPGVDSVHIQPFIARDLEERLSAEREAFGVLRGAIPSDDVVRIVAQRTMRYIQPGQDPLATAVKILDKSASMAGASGHDDVRSWHMVEAFANVFKHVNPREVESTEELIETLPRTLEKSVYGQDAVINALSSHIASHIRGARVANTPLSVFLPGPSGVGKTLVAETIAKHFSMPSLIVQLSQYTERHAVSRLVGSPPGYVDSHEGVLSEFVKNHARGIVFFDEYEKAHPEVQSFIMNFIDRGTLTSGNGTVHYRPNMIIMAASNAGAEVLHPGISSTDLQEVVAKALTPEGMQLRRELANRFTIIPVHAVEEGAFRRVIEDNLFRLCETPQFVNDNLRVTGVDHSAVDLIFDSVKAVCGFRPCGQKRYGFGHDDGTKETGRYYLLRQIPRAIDQAFGEEVLYLHSYARLVNEKSPRIVGCTLSAVDGKPHIIPE